MMHKSNANSLIDYYAYIQLKLFATKGNEAKKSRSRRDPNTAKDQPAIQPARKLRLSVWDLKLIAPAD